MTTVHLDAQALPTRVLAGPANRVTSLRAVLTGVVGALVLAAYAGRPATAVLVGVAGVALALDAVDGWLARRTGTVTAFGARFDLEVDAALVLVLSVLVAGQVGLWVLLAGAARYLLLGAERLWPRLAHPVPPRRWRKVVAALLGVSLTVVAGGLLGPTAATVLLATVLALLAWSFATQVHEVLR